jgi:signal peptidase II
MRPMFRFLALLCLVWTLVGCDHVSKHLARTNLSDGSVYPVAGSAFDLRYTENRDIAFNLMSSLPDSVKVPLIFGSGALAILALAATLFLSRKLTLPQTLALAAVLAGALGNFIDRAWHGYVVDFLHVKYWPVFNVADIYVTVGVVALVLFGGSLARPRAAPR